MRRVVLALLWVAAAAAPASCAKIWGIDDGLPYPDASNDVGTPTDGTLGDDTTQDSAGEATLDGAADVNDGGADTLLADDAGDATDAPGDASCDVDNNWCVTHCGLGPDNCGISTGCGNTCGIGDGIFCDGSTSQCDCTSDPSWCNNRCGETTDNCGRPVDCTSGCGPDACVPQGGACGGLSCGTTKDSCGNTVNCGVGGTINCANNGVCDAGQCCQIINNPCTGFCNQAPNGCGGTVNCSQNCPSGETCNTSTNACTCPIPTCGANACGTITNSCLQTSNCGTCGANQNCVANQCCTLPSCGNACNTTMSNGCGSVTCSCTLPATCVSGQCCAPGTCSAQNCLDTCGNFTSACCHDASSCSGLGSSCSGTPCCSGQDLQCNGSTCCSVQGGFCNSTGDCCSGSGLQCLGNTCSFVAEAGGPEAGGPEAGGSEGGACIHQGMQCVPITGTPCCSPASCQNSGTPDGGTESLCQ